MSADEYSDGLKSYFNNPFKGTGIGLGWINAGDNSLNHNSNGGNSLNISRNNKRIIGNNPSKTDSQSRNGDLNSTYYSYGSSGIAIASASSSGGDSSGVDNQQSYEITKKIDDDVFNVQTIVMIVVVLIFLIVGYKRKKHN